MLPRLRGVLFRAGLGHVSLSVSVLAFWSRLGSSGVLCPSWLLASPGLARALGLFWPILSSGRFWLFWPLLASPLGVPVLLSFGFSWFLVSSRSPGFFLASPGLPCSSWLLPVSLGSWLQRVSPGLSWSPSGVPGLLGLLLSVGPSGASRAMSVYSRT